MFQSCGGNFGRNITNDMSITSSSKIKTERVIVDIISGIAPYVFVGLIIYGIFKIFTIGT